jgi:SAM-dependent methyltransferase
MEKAVRYEVDTSDLPRNFYPPLKLTGERTLPGVAEENYWFQRHLVAYQYLLRRVQGKRVLDLGCGEGYGVDLLASRAAEAVGVDMAPEAIYHARATYRRPNLRFLHADIFALGLEDASFDLVCSLQVIEHLRDPGRFMEEARRVLSPGGMCLITTPNRAIISSGRDTPINPFHIFEFDHLQLREFMDKYYPRVEMLGVFHAAKLRLHDLLTRRNFSQFCLDIPPRLDRLFYQPVFIPRLSTGDFRIKGDALAGALDFIAMGWKTNPKPGREAG